VLSFNEPLNDQFQKAVKTYSKKPLITRETKDKYGVLDAIRREWVGTSMTHFHWKIVRLVHVLYVVYINITCFTSFQDFGVFVVDNHATDILKHSHTRL
jgi:hypothetical protein